MKYFKGDKMNEKEFKKQVKTEDKNEYRIYYSWQSKNLIEKKDTKR